MPFQDHMMLQKVLLESGISSGWFSSQEEYGASEALLYAICHVI